MKLTHFVQPATGHAGQSSQITKMTSELDSASLKTYDLIYYMSIFIKISKIRFVPPPFSLTATKYAGQSVSTWDGWTAKISLEMDSATQKTYKMIPHMTYKWF